MKKYIKVIGIGFSLLALIFAIIYKSVEKINVPSITKQKVVEFEKLNAKLYLSARAWGISGGHEEIVLSSFSFEESKQCSKDECFIFYSSEIYYKKQGDDTLMIYATESGMSEAPVNFKSQVKIVRIGLKNNSEEKDYWQNYKKYGCSKISINNEN